MKFTLNFILLITLALSSYSYAETEELYKITQQFPKEIKPDFIDKSPINNLYILSNARGSMLIDASGRYLIVGQLLDLKSEQEITNQIYQNHYSINVKELPLNQALKEIKGNGKRVLYVFADPDCPVCQTLQEISEDLDDITIYTFPFALTHLHPSALETSKKIWCSTSPLKSWKEYLLENKKPKNNSVSCLNPIDKNMQLANQLKITLTPSIFNSHGHRISGIPEFEELEEFIDE